MQPEASNGHRSAVKSHPLAELLRCPPATGGLLNSAAQCIDVQTGSLVFRQGERCRGLYVVVAGQFQRKSERASARLTLGVARPGDLVELAAALGDGRHTYSLVAQTPGSLLLLPWDELHRAFEEYPPLRMQLLEELAREVSRGYYASCQDRMPKTRRRTPGSPGTSQL